MDLNMPCLMALAQMGHSGCSDGLASGRSFIPFQAVFVALVLLDTSCFGYGKKTPNLNTG
jgi:hypothetical protein